jgi:hypothetical protein
MASLLGACCCSGWLARADMSLLSAGHETLVRHLTDCLLMQSGCLASMWQGLRLLLAAVPRAKWREAAPYGDI